MTSEGAFLKSFDDFLLEAIEDVLKQAFGETLAGVILLFTLAIFKSNREDNSLKLGENPELFSDALREVLGAGSIYVEELILKSLYSELGVRFKKKKDYKFSDYIKKLRLKFCVFG